jgi:hypothetical protein
MQPIVVSKTPLSRIEPFLNDNPPNQALSVALNNGLVYVGTLWDNGLVFGMDCSNPVVPRVVSVYAYGDFILTWVGGLLFIGPDLFVGGSLGYTYPVGQFDISLPRDSINQYFPPAALQNPAPPEQARTKFPRQRPAGRSDSELVPKLRNGTNCEGHNPRGCSETDSRRFIPNLSVPGRPAGTHE